MAKKYMSENDYKNADYTNGYAKNEADKATDKADMTNVSNKSVNPLRFSRHGVAVMPNFLVWG